jgi:ribonuclease D
VSDSVDSPTDADVDESIDVSDVPAAPEIPWLLTPVDGIPPVITTAAELANLISGLSAGSGPVALDAERASGYRFSQRAYLVQLRREGFGNALIDPIACPDLSGVNDALRDAEWVIHAASQDLPCLSEMGMFPDRLFDTELAGRLLGYPRVALGTLIEQRLGVRLEKGHSAVDWSTRPLPESWLAYAALDVELLLELRNDLEQELAENGKLAWAVQEFEAARHGPTSPPVPRAEPWRRLSGIHRLRRPRQLAAARALWEARNTKAEQQDIAPGRILPDSAIIAAAGAELADEQALRGLPVFRGPRQQRQSGLWWSALREAAQLDETQLPRMTAGAQPGALPHACGWAEPDPAAAERLTRVRAFLTTIAVENTLPVENLLEPALSRRIAWDAPTDVSAALSEGGARPWQIGLTAAGLAAALTG